MPFRPRHESYAGLQRQAARFLFTRPTLVTLLVAALANLLKLAWLQDWRPTWLAFLPPAPKSDLVIAAASSLDLFSVALAFVAARAFSSARAADYFRQLHLADVPWRQAFAPLFDGLIALGIADALLELTLRLSFSDAISPYSSALEFAFMMVASLAAAWFLANLLILLNILRLPIAIQLLASYCLSATLVIGVSLLTVPLADLLEAWAYGSWLTSLGLAMLYPLQGNNANYVMGELIMITLLAIALALLALAAGYLGRKAAPRLLAEEL